MLQFIFGKPATGKSYTIVEKISEAVEVGKTVVLIVPEQFSFESEKAVLKRIGDSAALNVCVMSFSRLYDEVGRYSGMTAGTVLSDSDKIIMMKRALGASKNDVFTGRYFNSISYAKAVLDTIGEFKINSVTPYDLKSAALGISSDSIRNKLNDISVIYENYDLIVGENYIDPADRLMKLYSMLEVYKYFEGKTVFFDAFKGFTGQQYKIIDRIFSQTDDVCFSFTNNTLDAKEFDIFSNIRKTVDKIEKLASNNGIKTAKPVILEKQYYKSQSLKALQEIVSGKNAKFEENDGGITVCSASNRFDEADFVAETIRKSVREEGYRYRDFVIIARDASDYEQAVECACEENGVKCFIDKRMELSYFCGAVAVMNAIKASEKFSSESILRFNKTGLGTLSNEEISLLENYVFLWKIDGAMWKNQWDMDVRGFVTEPAESEHIEKLDKINELRQRAIYPIINFKKSFKGTPKRMASAIIELFDECSVQDKLKSMSGELSKQSDTAMSDTLKQCYDNYIKLLESIVRCMPNVEVKREEFVSVLETAVSLSTVGIIPQTLDEVTFGSADRIRPSRPKIAFILGANQGVFPRTVSKSGVFTAFERKVLSDSGIDMGNDPIEEAIDEDFLVYTNLCCPSHRLYICYSQTSLSGESYEKSAFISQITENIACNEIKYPYEKLSEFSLPQTASTAFTRFCMDHNSNPQDAKTLKLALEQNGLGDKPEALEYNLKKDKSLSEDTVCQLYGRDLYMSASRIDTFSKCPFSYFCKYGIKADKLRPAEFNVLQRGTIIHYVLERLVDENKEVIASLGREKSDKLVDKYIEDYLDSITGYRSVETTYSRFIVANISKLLKDVVAHMIEEFAQSKFKPYGCEIKIGNGKEIPALKIPYGEGNVVITGSIDRVDGYDGYIRVVDYKTGKREFKISDVLYGLNLQMLIYLYAAIKGNSKGERAAGILYMQPLKEEKDKKTAMNGLLLKDLSVVEAMEAENKGKFVPKLSVNKDGTFSKTNSSFIEESDFDEVFKFIDKKISGIGSKIASGNIEISPVDGYNSPACKYCDFACVCGKDEVTSREVENLKTDEAVKKIREENMNGI